MEKPTYYVIVNESQRANFSGKPTVITDDVLFDKQAALKECDRIRRVWNIVAHVYELKRVK